MIPVAADAEQALAMIRSHPDGTVIINGSLLRGFI